jgi:hypothetical protein
MFFKKLMGGPKTADLTIVVKTALVSVMKSNTKEYLAPLVQQKTLQIIDAENLQNELHAFRIALWYLFAFQIVDRRLSADELGLRFGAALTVAVEEAQGASKNMHYTGDNLLEDAYSYIEDALELQSRATLEAEITFFLCQTLTRRALKNVSMTNPLRQQRQEQVFNVAMYVLRETEKIQRTFQESYTIVVT